MTRKEKFMTSKNEPKPVPSEDWEEIIGRCKCLFEERRDYFGKEKERCKL